MEFQAGKSIFLQIADTIIERVMRGELRSGDKIPSVRELASEMGVNPNTIMRTFSELQAMDIIENQRGIGYFVANEAQKIIMEKKKKDFFHQVLPDFIKQAEMLGITADELQKHIKTLN